jgi:hypothetical protein
MAADILLAIFAPLQDGGEHSVSALLIHVIGQLPHQLPLCQDPFGMGF